ncbi:hypothetical protein DH2020_013552 [Rehmannia glutinosa]|uniref:NAC domain-containing protein n=1 Tax=Rehmannia glutinosa TaxID=99300 RepID=A0ABR0X2L3_REHGL
MEEMMSFVRDGEKKLPPGFRFQPTDEEIVFQYLARKTFSYPLPAQVIPELINIFSFHPWELPAGNSDQDRYFFSNKETNHGNGNYQSGKTTCCGYWKATGLTKRIICSKNMPIVGIRKSLVFYKRKKSNSRAFRTDWIMHEYCLALSRNSACSNVQQKNNSQGSLIQIGNWSLCHIFLKKRSSITKVIDDDNDTNNCGFLSDTDSSSASSSPYSDSSCLTEVSSSIAYGETS